MNEPFLLSNLVELQDLDNKIYKLIDSKSNSENVLNLKTLELEYKNLSEKINEDKIIGTNSIKDSKIINFIIPDFSKPRILKTKF